MRMSRRLSLLPLLAGGSISAVAFAAVPQEGGLPLLAVLASLLPLQLAAVHWAFSREAKP
jgi:hypothetical protein